jgi:hypothetical protein
MIFDVAGLALAETDSGINNIQGLSLASLGGTAFCAFTIAGQSNLLFGISPDGSHWRTVTVSTQHAVIPGPLSLVAFAGRLYCAYKTKGGVIIAQFSYASDTLTFLGANLCLGGGNPVLALNDGVLLCAYMVGGQVKSIEVPTTASQWKKSGALPIDVDSAPESFVRITAPSTLPESGKTPVGGPSYSFTSFNGAPWACGTFGDGELYVWANNTWTDMGVYSPKGGLLVSLWNRIYLFYVDGHTGQLGYMYTQPTAQSQTTTSKSDVTTDGAVWSSPALLGSKPLTLPAVATLGNSLICVYGAATDDQEKSPAPIFGYSSVYYLESDSLPAQPPATAPASNANWMQSHWSQLADKPLTQLCLPGTHDSGTFELHENTLAPDASSTIQKLFNYADTDEDATGVRDYIKSMATSQSSSMSMYEQLANGIRYIDLRVCQVDGSYYTCHSLVGDPIPELLQDIYRFLSENPVEVVFVKVGLKGGIPPATGWGYLLDTFRSFGDDAGIGVAPRFTNFSLLTLNRLAAANFRCVLLADDDNIHGLYDSSKTTNPEMVSFLEQNTKDYGAYTLLEAQCFRPIGDASYALGYLQAQKSGALGPLAGLVNVGYNVGSDIKALFDGKSLDPVPTSLHQNAQNSRSIIRDYFGWLNNNPTIPKPQLMICDYFTEVPWVPLAIAISTGTQWPNLSTIEDVPLPTLEPEWFTSTILLAPALVVAGFKAAGIGCDEIAKYLQANVPGITGEVMGDALKGGGFVINEVASALNTVYGFAADALNDTLSQLGYAAADIESAFKDLGGDFESFFSDVGDVINPSNW